MSDAHPWPRTILHADMDAFFAAVEQRDRPELRGVPVIVGGPLRRGVVSTASYEARRYGVHSAMPMAEAVRRCRDAVVVPPDMARYAECSERIMEVFGRFSPLVEPLSLDEAFLDMTGTEGLFGGPGEAAERIRREVREATGGLTISVGVSCTKYVAKVASDRRKPDGLTVVPPGEVAAFLDPLPVSCLWGVGAKTLPRFEALGLATIGDVARAPRPLLEAELGALGPHAWMLANGIDDREVVPDRDARSVGAETTLAEDVTGEAAVSGLLGPLADRVARRVRRTGLLAGGVRVKLKTDAFRLHTRQARLRAPADTAEAFMAAARALLGELDLGERFRLVGMAAYDLRAEGDRGQLELFLDPRGERARRLERTVDAVCERFGDDALVKGGRDEEP
ncbi:MAG: DNA polymerase IV [Proteobacteria bacterium]|nr:DNA polymerase IV [Pseudomonadota bacterium]